MDLKSQSLMFFKLVNHGKVLLEGWVEVVFHDLSFTKESPLHRHLIECIKVDLRVAFGEDVKVLKFQTGNVEFYHL